MANIIIIDDDTLVLELLAKMVERMGHNAIPFSDAEVALAEIASGNCELLITDIVMPNIDGIELLRTLTPQARRFKIIAISGGGRIRSENYLEIATLLGADVTFEKPIDWKEFQVAVERLLGE